jgi:hypothetical protein
MCPLSFSEPHRIIKPIRISRPGFMRAYFSTTKEQKATKESLNLHSSKSFEAKLFVFFVTFVVIFYTNKVCERSPGILCHSPADFRRSISQILTDLNSLKLRAPFLQRKAEPYTDPAFLPFQPY